MIQSHVQTQTETKPNPGKSNVLIANAFNKHKIRFGFYALRLGIDEQGVIVRLRVVTRFIEDSKLG